MKRDDLLMIGGVVIVALATWELMLKDAVTDFFKNLSGGNSSSSSGQA